MEVRGQEVSSDGICRRATRRAHLTISSLLPRCLRTVASGQLVGFVTEGDARRRHLFAQSASQSAERQWLFGQEALARNMANPGPKHLIIGPTHERRRGAAFRSDNP